MIYTEQPKGVPDHIWRLYVIYRDEYERLYESRIHSRGAHDMEREHREGMKVWEVVLKALKDQYPVYASKVFEMFQHHRDLDKAAGVPITTEGIYDNLPRKE